jgi:hypothetical protein
MLQPFRVHIFTHDMSRFTFNDSLRTEMYPSAFALLEIAFLRRQEASLNDSCLRWPEPSMIRNGPRLYHLRQNCPARLWHVRQMGTLPPGEN